MNTVFDSTSLQTSPAVAVLGVPFDPVTMTEALGAIGRMVASRRPHYVVTANVDFLVQAREDVELRRILLDAHLVVCDGTPVLWASRLLGNPLPERVAGADLVPRLIRIAAEQNLRVFFLGGTTDSMARAVANVKATHPSLIIEGYSPPFHPLLEMDHDEIKRRIAEAKPDLLFVSFGCPKQEKWIAMHYQSLGVPVAIGVGGTIDFLAGQLKRAPAWMQRTGTEWLFRLAQEPRRLFKRYARDLSVFGWLFVAQWCAMQLRGGAFRRRRDDTNESCGPRNPKDRNSNWREKNLESSASRCHGEPIANYAGSRSSGFVPRHSLRDDLKQRGMVSTRLKAGPGWQWIQLPHRLDAATVRNDALLCDPILADGRHCLLQMDRVAFMDSTGMGWLLRLHKRIRATGRQLVLIAPHATVKHDLSLLHLKEFFACAPDFPAAQELIEKLTLEEHEWVRSTAFLEANWKRVQQGRKPRENSLLAFFTRDKMFSRRPLPKQIVSWRGEITAANATPVWQETEKLLAAEANSLQPIVIDLSQVRFMDSTGLGLMVRAQKHARRNGIKLSFAEPQPTVLNVLRMAGLENYLLGEPV